MAAIEKRQKPSKMGLFSVILGLGSLLAGCQRWNTWRSSRSTWPPQGSQGTLVRIVTFNSEVVAGQRFGFGPYGPGMANVYVPVQPTTVEENLILKALAKNLK